MAVTVPSGRLRLQVVAMEYHQRRASWLTGDEEFEADDWTHPTFREDERAAWARDGVATWLVNWREGLAHAQWMLDQIEDEQAAAVGLAHWLDSLLYGGGLGLCPRDQWASVQVTADSMARADFCRMNFGALAARVREAGVTAAPMA